MSAGVYFTCLRCCRTTNSPHCTPCLLADLSRLRAQLAEAREVIRSVEWAGYRGWGPPCCPWCEHFDPSQLGEYGKYPKVADNQGHAPDCRLARALVDF